MVKLGLTGGIGSGKSTVAKIFEEFNIPVYYADDRAKWLMNQPKIRSKIVQQFGKEAYNKGKLDRAFLANLVFKNRKALEALNGIVHPEVGKDFDNWSNYQKSQILVKEAAVLIESGAKDSVDEIVVVTAPAKTRMKRVMARDGVSEQQVVDRLNNQMTDKQRLKYADYVIDNSGEQMLIPQVKRLLEDVRRKYHLK
ncbi:dephospho-CoA kinase [Parvicella tangerina]|uniref:Dephospho-CoA kinase n=1 Tax=Parvicella tangerina TaxID=2829795 RepID=A0A916NIP9_9FLAO|nr:dephospho-CoA kinase [Parvicella tangerina]CAG5085605.1 Dephospho-CoA kinase [Parvicella tangerina]